MKMQLENAVAFGRCAAVAAVKQLAN